MSSNSWTWECPHTKDGADHVPLIFLSSVWWCGHAPWRLTNELMQQNEQRTKDLLFLLMDLIALCGLHPALGPLMDLCCTEQSVEPVIEGGSDQQTVSDFWSPRASPQTRASTFLISFFFNYETMANCSQNWWIDWRILPCCVLHNFFTRTFSRFVRPLIATILCISSIYPKWRT